MIIRTWPWGEGGSFLVSSEETGFLGPLSGLMKLLRSKGVVIVLVLGSLGARGRNLLQPSVRKGSCSQINPRVN